MRQTAACAWLLALLDVAACSGEQFTTGARNAGGSPSAVVGSDRHDEGGDSYLPEDDRSESPGYAGTSGGAAGKSGGAGKGGGAAGNLTASGGTSGSPPSPGGPMAANCASGAITFRMLPGAELTEDYLCDAGCGTGWLSITDADGTTAFSISSACGTASCETCEVQACGAASCLPTPLTAKGSELTWTGTYLAKDTCGDNMACQRQTCVKPGRYKARACAALNQGQNTYGGCTPQQAQLCAEAEFEFPGPARVDLRLAK